MTSTAPGAHPPPEEVDTLLDPAGGDAQVAAHVDTCPRCRQVREDLRAVRALLGAQAGSLPPEPPDLGARIAAALAAEPPLRPAGPAADGRPAGGWERSEGGQVVTLPTRRRRWPAYLAVAASVAVVGIGGTVLVDGLRTSGVSSSAGAASEVQPGSAEDDSGGGSAPAVTSLPPGAVPQATDKGSDAGGTDAGVRASGTDYTRADLTAQAEALLAAGGLGVQREDAVAEGFDASTRASCLAGIGRTGADPVATDLATFEGEPATVLVLATAPGHEVLVVPSACGRGDDRVLASASLP